MAVPPFDLDRDIPDPADSGSLPPALAAEVDHLSGRSDRWCDPTAPVHAALRARALVDAGRPREAAKLLGSTSDGPWPPHALAAASWCLSRVSVPPLVEVLETEARELREGFLVDDGLPVGAAGSVRGNLASARGDLEAAAECFAEAVAQGDRRAPFWGALARLDLARVRICAAGLRAGSGPAPGADPHVPEDVRANLASARTFFAAGGYEHLLARADELLVRCTGADGSVGDDPAPPPPPGTSDPCVGHLLPADANGGASRGGSTRRWVVGFGIQPPVEVPHRLGLVGLRHLISQRGREVPAVELVEVLDRAGGRGTGRASTDEAVTDAYRQLRRLRADPTLDPDEVSSAVRALLHDDRARSRTAKLLRRTIDQLAGAHPLLAEHLAATVTTGYTCAYRSPPAVRWWL